MRKRNIKSGKVPVGAGFDAILYATVNPRPKGSGSRLREAASPTGPEAAWNWRRRHRGMPQRRASTPRRQAPSCPSSPPGGCPPHVLRHGRKPATCSQILGLNHFQKSPCSRNRLPIGNRLPIVYISLSHYYAGMYYNILHVSREGRGTNVHYRNAPRQSGQGSRHL